MAQRKNIKEVFNIMIDNLPLDITEKTLMTVFKCFGEIQGIIILNSKNESKKHAYIKYFNEVDANTACRERNGYLFGSNVITVQRRECKSRNLYSETLESSSIANNAVNNMAQVKNINPSLGITSFYDNSKGPVKKFVKLLVTSIEDPITLWAHVVDENSIMYLEKINEKVTAYSSNIPFVTQIPDTQKMYAAVFEADKEWYRCKVLENQDMNTSLIRYIDFGNTEIVNNSKLIELPPDVSEIESQARLYRLIKVNSPDKITEKAAYDKAMLYLINNFTDKMIEGRIMIKNKIGYFLLDATFNNVNIAQDMVQRGLLSPMASNPSKSYGNSGSNFQLTKYTCQNGIKQIESKNFSPQDALIQEGSLLRIGNFTAQNSNLEQVNQKENIKILESERDHAKKELSLAKNTISKMEREITRLHQFSKKADFISKVTNVMTNFAKIRQIRHNFPSDPLVDDPLMKAINLMISFKDLILCDYFESISRITSSINEYKGCQNSLIFCKDKIQQKEIISRRDEIRILLCQQLQNFIKSSQQVPLQQHLQKLNNTCQMLARTFGNYLNLNILPEQSDDEILKAYMSLRTARQNIYQEVHSVTNRCQDNVLKSLEKLKGALSFEDPSGSNSDSSNIDLNKAFTELNEAINQENKLNDFRYNQDVIIIGQTVHLLHKKMNSLHQQLQILLFKEKEYQEKNDSLQIWLYKKPDLKRIKIYHSNIRSLKSKLRHKLADKKDLEEDDDKNDQKFHDVLKELKEIQKELHQALILEEKELLDLAHLQSHHFSELLYDFPELSKIWDSCGLVKYGRSLDQFDLIPFSSSCNSSKQLWKTIFNNSEFILKEYIITSCSGNLMKENFIKRALTYYKVKHRNLQTLSALFFSNNDRTAYLQLKFVDFNIKSYIESGRTISEKCLQKILIGILKGLHELHTAGVIHGALYPNNILVSSDGDGILSEFDFTKSLNERINLTSSKQTNLMFDISQVCGLNTCSTPFDIYMFGLLILWFHQPIIPVKFTLEGISNLMDLNLSPDVLEVIQACLQSNSKLRPSANDLLHYSYFSNTLNSELIYSGESSFLDSSESQPVGEIPTKKNDYSSSLLAESDVNSCFKSTLSISDEQDVDNSFTPSLPCQIKEDVLKPPQNTPENYDNCELQTDFNMLTKALQQISFKHLNSNIQAETMFFPDENADVIESISSTSSDVVLISEDKINDVDNDN